MAFRDLDAAEIDLVLSNERIVRLSFAAESEVFVVPVFYVWTSGALHGFTTPGRKTRMATVNSVAGFQVDSTVHTGPWEWASVSGQGAFEVLDDSAEAMAFAPELGSRLADAPPWAEKTLNERFERLGRVAWRLRPDKLHGRAHGPEEPGDHEIEAP